MSGISVILNQNEASRLNESDRALLNDFILDSNPEEFKKNGTLIFLAYTGAGVMRRILKANPHWDSIPNSPYAALKKERNALKTQFRKLQTGKETIADQMKAVEAKIKEFKCNLEKTNPQMAKLARQWDCDKISEIKKRLGAAVQLQREYYDTTWIGSISKFFLKLVFQWNNGDTAAIQSALVMLYNWDFEQPLHPLEYDNFLLKPYKLTSNEYAKGCRWNKDNEQIGDVPWLRTSWIQQHLKTDHLYNEPLSKQITIVNVPAVKTA